MSIVQTKDPLSLEQARGILENLSLLTSPAHQNSKLVFYDTKIDLEPDSSTWRTLYAWTSPVTTRLNYYYGNDASETRDLTALPALMERVHQAFNEHQNGLVHYKDIKPKFDLIEKAEGGLLSLKEKRYITQPEKAQIIQIALATLQKTKKIYQEKCEDSFLKAVEAAKSNNRQEQEAKTQEIAMLKQRVAELERSAEQNQKTNAILLQVVSSATQENQQKLVERDRVIAAQALSNPIDLENVPTTVIIERIRVLLEVVNSRQPK
jgi:hypothetical protein